MTLEKLKPRPRDELKHEIIEIIHQALPAVDEILISESVESLYDPNLRGLALGRALKNLEKNAKPSRTEFITLLKTYSMDPYLKSRIVEAENALRRRAVIKAGLLAVGGIAIAALVPNAISYINSLSKPPVIEPP